MKLLYSTKIDGQVASLRTTQLRAAATAQHDDKRIASMPSRVHPTGDVSLDQAEKLTRSRLPAIVHPTGPRHQAPFMVEITNFVQTQLQLLDRRFIDATELPMEYFRLRREVFRRALQMFTDAFTIHRMFLDAVDDECHRYTQMLEERCTQLEGRLASSRDELEGVRRDVASREATWKSAMEGLQLSVAEERRQVEAVRAAHLEAAVRERAVAPDNRRQLQELQLRAATLAEENASLTTEVDRLRRLSESLSLETFSDNLQRALEQLREARESLMAKEDQIAESNDAVEDLSRDLRLAVAALNKALKRPTAQSELRLTKRGLDAIARR